MVRFHILLITLSSDSCPYEELKPLREMIGKTPSDQEIVVEILNHLPSSPQPGPPDLVLLRSDSIKEMEEVLCPLKRYWSEVPILGLVCQRSVAFSDIHPLLIQGLADFLCCPFREVDLIPRIQRLLHPKRATPAAPKASAIEERVRVDFLVGESEPFLREIDKIPCMARCDTTVLILGETGTGKELFARAIHYQGPRRRKPFVPVNCGALPDHLFENELFGHVKGAYTDAFSEERGLLAEAEGGTLFLDEIDALSPAAQVKLLRFLQDREYRPLGSAKSRVADVRIIAASNADLRKQVEMKRFREDLYYRLNVLYLFLPPLRERIGDIPLLVHRFLTLYRKGTKLTPGAMQKLLSYAWPGNVRELEGVIQRALILSPSPLLDGEQIHLQIEVQRGISDRPSHREGKRQAIHQFEQAYLADLLAKHQGNITHAADAIGMKRQALQRLLRKYSLPRSAFEHLA